MEALTQADILGAFSGREEDMPLPDLGTIDWDVLDYLGWIHPDGHIGYLVVISPTDGSVKGVSMRRSRFTSGKRGFEMCSLCHHVHSANGTAMFTIAARKNGRSGTSRMWLGAASLLGCIFLWLKISEYLAKAEAGIGIETNTFFTLYYLLTGFHLLHVVFGLAVLAIVAVWNSVENLETGCAFWHMVDLVWVLIFPVIYLVH